MRMKSNFPVVFSSTIGSPGVRGAPCADKAAARARQPKPALHRNLSNPFLVSFEIVISFIILATSPIQINIYFGDKTLVFVALLRSNDLERGVWVSTPRLSVECCPPSLRFGAVAPTCRAVATRKREIRAKPAVF